MAYYTITANTPQGRDIIARSQQGTAEERVQERIRRGDFSTGGDGSRERQREIEAARKKEAYYDERAKLLLSGGSFQGYTGDDNWLESGLSSITDAITPLSVMGLAGGAALAGVGSGAGAGGAAEAAGAGGAGGFGGVGAATANQQGLYQMAFDLGLEGTAADAFVASGGTLGSTAAGGGGVMGMSGTGVLPQSSGPGASAAGAEAWRTGATNAAGTSAAGTALSRIIDGTATTADWVSVLGTAGATGLGIYSSNQKANTLEKLAAESRADRAPYLQASQGWLANPSSYMQGPGQAAMKGTLAGLSATFGNPIGSGAALQLGNEAALRNWQNAVTGFGNLGLAGEDTRAQLNVGAAQSDADRWSTLAGGVSDILNPRKSTADYLREYKIMGLI